MSKRRLNDLTIISEEYSIKEGKTTRRAADCQCICGKVLKKIKMSSLRDGSRKRCPDCSFRLRSERNTVPIYDQLFKRLVMHRGIANDIPVSITIEDYKNIVSRDCYYCGDEPSEYTYFSKKRKYVNSEPIFINGIDRLDSDKGYTIDNCLPCCPSCNYSKHTLTMEQFKDKIRKIYINLKL